MIGTRASRLNRSRSLAVAILATIGILALAMPSASAAPAKHPKQVKPPTISVSINKGETYTIKGVKENTSPVIKSASNPNALVVNTAAPGQIVLVGADSGSSKIEVTLASGKKVIYAVTVNAIAPAQGSLSPGSAPTTIP